MRGFKDSIKVSTPNNKPLDLSHQVNTTFDFFQFRPVLCEEVYPSEKFSVHLRDYYRAKPLAGAVYANMYKKYACFFVPYRILWDKWSDFNTGGSNGKLEFNEPYITYYEFAKIAVNLYSAFDAESGSVRQNLGAVYRNMLDYWSDLGVDISILYGQDDLSVFDATKMSKLHIPIKRFLACRAIWFDWFRDQNLIGDDVRDIYCPKSFASSGLVTPDHDYEAYESFYVNPSVPTDTILQPLPVCVEKDYFTTMMTEPQRGGAAFVPVSLPSVDVNPGFATATSTSSIGITADSQKVFRNAPGFQTNANDIIGMFDYNLVRVAKGVQKYLEKNNIAGGADLQQLLAHWGTAPNPAVFQRSTYIGSFTDSMRIEEVVSPADTDAGSIAGEVSTKINMTGNGKFEYTANEHGFLVIVQIARPENTYTEGTRREVLHGCLGNGRFDYFTPELEKTGFQPAYAYEKCSQTFLSGSNADPFACVGYVPRYAENKRQYNRFTGQMSTYLFRDLRVVRDFGAAQYSDNDLFINADFTQIYGYPTSYRYDRFFEGELADLDHFDGWIAFDIKVDSPRSDYASPLIENSKGDDITLPYAGVRM